MYDRKKHVIAVDFDAVIASYIRPFKYDKLGKPNSEVIKTMQYYYDNGYYILIFTGRQFTPTMEKWLKKHKVPYDGFNVDPRPLPLADSFKPYYDVIIDDKAINVDWKNNIVSKEELIKEIDFIISKGNEGKE